MSQHAIDQTYRPVYHFTAGRGWLNDPNGVIYYRGTYHLFFQHNPDDTHWGNMTWGHAVGPDLVHWRQVEPALYPDELGAMFSGTAMVDHRNVLGLQRAAAMPTLVLFYTAAGGTSAASAGRLFTQCLATSTDGGHTFVKHPANPVAPCLGHCNRDPRVFWHAPSQGYVMVLNVGHPHPTETDGNGNPRVIDEFYFLRSQDLLNWEVQSRTPDFYECPEFFEIAVGGTDETYWVLWGASGEYLIGHFDGRVFTPVSERLVFDYGANYYAAQCFANLPRHRHVSIAWMRGGHYPGMPFNQQLTFPSESMLRRDSAGLRLYRSPIAEISTLYRETTALPALVVAEPCTLIASSADAAHDVALTLMISPDAITTVAICGHPFRLDARQQALSFANCALPVECRGEPVALRLLLDRTSVEIYADGGRAAGSWCFVPVAGAPVLSLTCETGKVSLLAGTATRLGSCFASNGD